MSILGPRALEDHRLITGWDSSEILRFQMIDGQTPQQAIALAETVVGEENTALAARYALVTTITQLPNAKMQRVGNSTRTMTPERTQFAPASLVRSDEIGHMLPLLPYTDAVGWSTDWLKRAMREMVRNDLDFIKERWRNRVEYGFWIRVLTNTENLIGTTGYDVGWAIGTGTSVNFVPIQHGAFTFDSTHTHYLRLNGVMNAANAETALIAAALQLTHHGHTGRKIAFVSQADVTLYLTMTAANVVRLLSSGMQAVTGGSSTLITTTGTLEGVPGEPFMILLTPWGEIELRWHERIPTGYFWMTKSYGANSSMNGVALRVERGEGAGFGLRPNPQIDRSIQPRLESIQFEADHGWGINDRTNGVAYYIASGGTTYTNPTIA